MVAPNPFKMAQLSTSSTMPSSSDQSQRTSISSRTVSATSLVSTIATPAAATVSGESAVASTALAEMPTRAPFQPVCAPADVPACSVAAKPSIARTKTATSLAEKDTPLRRSARIAALRTQSGVESDEDEPTDSPTWRPHHGGIKTEETNEGQGVEGGHAPRRRAVMIIADSDEDEDDEQPVATPAAVGQVEIITLSDSSPDSVTLAASSERGDSSPEQVGSSPEVNGPADVGVRSPSPSSAPSSLSSSGSSALPRGSDVAAAEPVQSSEVESPRRPVKVKDEVDEQRLGEQCEDKPTMEQQQVDVLGEIKREQDDLVAVKKETDSDKRLVPLEWRFALLSPAEYVALTPPTSTTRSAFVVKGEDVDSQVSLVLSNPLNPVSSEDPSSAPHGPSASPTSSSSRSHVVKHEDDESALPARPSPADLSLDDFPYPDPPTPDLSPSPPRGAHPMSPSSASQERTGSLAAGKPSSSELLLQRHVQESALRAHGSADAVADRYQGGEDVVPREPASRPAAWVGGALEEQAANVERSGLVAAGETEDDAAAAMLKLARAAEARSCTVM